jgi:hypothetical protein
VRIAWVHPTWRDLVIDRLAGDARLRQHFLSHCGPHGIALALSTSGGAEGERQFPLVPTDEDWDTIGDRIYATAPELEPREAAIVLAVVDQLLDAVLDDAMLAGEGAALARTVLARFGEVWADAHTAVELSCVDAWRLSPKPWPTFLPRTWGELLPMRLPDDRAEIQRFTDWLALYEMVLAFSTDLLEELGYGRAQDALIASFRESSRGVRGHREETGDWDWVTPRSEADESSAQWTSDAAVRRVLADL